MVINGDHGDPWRSMPPIQASGSTSDGSTQLETTELTGVGGVEVESSGLSHDQQDPTGSN